MWLEVNRFPRLSLEVAIILEPLRLSSSTPVTFVEIHTASSLCDTRIEVRNHRKSKDLFLAFFSKIHPDSSLSYYIDNVVSIKQPFMCAVVLF
jgi:hypothetical protein